MRVDVAVLGAGIVGSSVAAHLAMRGVKTALVDRRDPGQETSFGNAGLIEPSGVVPLAFPRDPMVLAKAALGLMPHVNYPPQRAAGAGAVPHALLEGVRPRPAGGARPRRSTRCCRGRWRPTASC